MDNQLVATIIIAIGALAGTLIPYIVKVFNDPAIKFDVNYGYSLIVALVITVLGMIPDSVPELTIKVGAGFFLTGYGLQSVLNKLVPPTTKPEINA